MKLFGLLPRKVFVPVQIRTKTSSGGFRFNRVQVPVTESRGMFSLPLTKDTLLAIRDSAFQDLIHKSRSKGKKLYIDCGSWNDQLPTDDHLHELCENATKEIATNPDFRLSDSDLMIFLASEAQDSLKKAGIHSTTETRKSGLFGLCGENHLFIVDKKEALVSKLDSIEMQDLSFLHENLSDFSEPGYDEKYFETILRKLDEGQSVKITEQINTSSNHNFGILIEVGYKPNEIRLGFYPGLNKKGTFLFLSLLKCALDRDKQVTVYQPGEYGSKAHNIFTVGKNPVDGFDIIIYKYSDINGSPDRDSFNYTNIFALTLHDLVQKNIVYLAIGRNEGFEPKSFEKYVKQIKDDVSVRSEIEQYQSVVSICPGS